MSIVAKRLDGSGYHLVRRHASAQAPLFRIALNKKLNPCWLKFPFTCKFINIRINTHRVTRDCTDEKPQLFHTRRHQLERRAAVAAVEEGRLDQRVQLAEAEAPTHHNNTCIMYDALTTTVKHINVWNICPYVQVLSSSWDERPFGHNRHGPKSGGCAPFYRGSLVPHLTTMSPGPRTSSVRSGILIHSAVWLQQTWAENEGEGAVLLWWELGSPTSNTMWPGPRPTYVPSVILIHPTVWPQ